jgi:hypothetical protein
LTLQGQDLILQARILGTEKLADLLGLLYPRPRYDAAARQEARGEEQHQEVPRDEEVVMNTNHAFRLLSETTVRENNPIAPKFSEKDRCGKVS